MVGQSTNRKTKKMSARSEVRTRAFRRTADLKPAPLDHSGIRAHHIFYCTKQSYIKYDFAFLTRTPFIYKSALVYNVSPY